jgi:hypothetical protein
MNRIPFSTVFFIIICAFYQTTFSAPNFKFVIAAEPFRLMELYHSDSTYYGWGITENLRAEYSFSKYLGTGFSIAHNFNRASEKIYSTDIDSNGALGISSSNYWTIENKSHTLNISLYPQVTLPIHRFTLFLNNCIGINFLLERNMGSPALGDALTDITKNSTRLVPNYTIEAGSDLTLGIWGLRMAGIYSSDLKRSKVEFGEKILNVRVGLLAGVFILF